MKMRIKDFANRFGLTFLVLLIAVVWTVGCSGLQYYTGWQYYPDPLWGWKAELGHEPDQAITKDYQDYIQKLPPEQKKYLRPVSYFEDGTGQHAARIEADVRYGTRLDHVRIYVHVLIYDKDFKRIKVIKYRGQL